MDEKRKEVYGLRCDWCGNPISEDEETDVDAGGESSTICKACFDELCKFVNKRRESTGYYKKILGK
jgi:formylmethanofuran dehydrogenase subunit E